MLIGTYSGNAEQTSHPYGLRATLLSRHLHVRSVRTLMLLHMAEYCDTPESKDRSTRNTKHACVKELYHVYSTMTRARDRSSAVSHEFTIVMNMRLCQGIEQPVRLPPPAQ